MKKYVVLLIITTYCSVVYTQINSIKPGQIIWNYDMDASTFSPPVIGEDGIIYVAFNFGSSNKQGKLYAFYPDGQVKWKFDAIEEIIQAPSIGNDGTIFFGTSSGLTSVKDRLYGLNPDGTEKYNYMIDKNLASSVAIGRDNTIYFYTDSLIAMDLDGTIKWKFKLDGSSYYSSPIIGIDNTIYMGGSKKFYAINQDGKQRWVFTPSGGTVGGAAIDSSGFIYVGFDGFYVASSDHRLFALKPDDGSVKWEFKPNYGISSSPVIGNNGVIYVCDNDTTMYAITSEGNEKWRFHKKYHYLQRTPSIGSDGRIYLGTKGNGYFVSITPDGSLNWTLPLGDSNYSNCAIGEDGTIYTVNSKNGLCAISSEAFGLARSAWPKALGGNQNYGRPDDPPPSIDLGIARTPMDSLTELDYPCDFKVTIKNFGTSEISAFKIAYQINKDSPVIEEFNNIILPNTVSEYTFRTSWTPKSTGVQQLKFYTILANDQRSINDSICKKIRVEYSNDIGISSIDVPSGVGVNKPVNIAVKIKNFGIGSQSNFPISYSFDLKNWITETCNQIVEPQKISTYTFTKTWTPLELGTYQIVVKTGLNDDQNKSNDEIKNDISVVNSAYMGKWQGKTSQGLPMYIQVNSKDEIDSIAVDIKVSFGSASCTFTFSSTKPIPIVNDTFSVEVFGSIFIPSGEKYPGVHGIFKNSSTCEGTISKFMAAGGVCNGLIVGTGYSNSSKTWSITRTSWDCPQGSKCVVKPGKASTPTGNTALCQNSENQSYSTTGASGASSYSWYISPSDAGKIINNGQNAIIDFDNTFKGTAKITVKGINGDGEGQNSDELTIIVGTFPEKASKPTGVENLCQNSDNQTYTVNNIEDATSYIWSISPSNAGIISSNGQSAIVDFDNSYFGQAQISVKGQNSCGEGQSSELLIVNIGTTPEKTSKPTGTENLCQNPDNQTYAVSKIENITSYIWSISPLDAGIITGNGQSAIVNFDNSYTGEAQISVKGQNSCGDGQSSEYLIVAISICNYVIQPDSKNKIRIYPNPSNGLFNIQFEEPLVESRIEILNSFSQIIQSSLIKNTNIYQSDLKTKGIYFLKIINKNFIITKKIIID